MDGHPPPRFLCLASWLLATEREVVEARRLAPLEALLGMDEGDWLRRTRVALREAGAPEAGLRLLGPSGLCRSSSPPIAGGARFLGRTIAAVASRAEARRLVAERPLVRDQDAVHSPWRLAVLELLLRSWPRDGGLRVLGIQLFAPSDADWPRFGPPEGLFEEVVPSGLQRAIAFPFASSEIGPVEVLALEPVDTHALSSASGLFSLERSTFAGAGDLRGRIMADGEFAARAAELADLLRAA